ncbi:hypothetical protein FBU30_000532 [Linnemannia zychae]|nr:hypothetical protein FBU30_000532 [Linnemannia zychae]
MSTPPTSAASAAQRKIRFGTINGDSGSDSESDSEFMENLNAPPTKDDYYDPIYFDSDEEDEYSEDDTNLEQIVDNDQDDDEKEYDSRAGLSINISSAAAATGAGGTKFKSNGPISDITARLKESTMDESTKPAPKNKKHATISNADLLYDPDEDDRDENWLIKKISANRPPGCRPEDIWTDAILSCPMCLTQLCFDCQQHDIYTHQFRAMFVEHCRVVETERLRFPNVPKKNNTKTKKAIKSNDSSSLTLEESKPPEFKPSEDDDMDAVYNPVVCEICNTRVALMDQDEVFHFFNVIPTAV